MSLLIKYLSLCWFRNNPADFHPSHAFMWKTVIFYLISGFIVEGLIADPADGILEVSLRAIMAFASIGTLLLFVKRWECYNQLFTAIFICENFIMTLATITEGLYFWMVMTHKENAEEISIAIGFLLVGWYIAIVSYILRQLLVSQMSHSVILAFSYFILTYGIPMLFMDI